ncbi:myoD family inhibitor domain-containing protein-like [Hippoglossus stenolepis]|uniref:myoD family inhibitor domain-containing protein-like n=1 Tax=Hippoglossus stenolepis TaxID=195615 RepID=UPI001FAFCF51|nr:myoD family inhibitor domain-containing protein-like [Hippoglossus stenolepis]
MSPGDHLPVDEQSNPTKGGTFLNSPQDIPSARDSVSGGNTIHTDLISTQPLPASPEVAGPRRPCDPKEPTCPRCGLTVPDHRPLPAPRDQSGLQGSSLSVHSSGSRRKKSRGSVVSSPQPAATTSDSCVHLLLACLWCQCSGLLLGLLEACSSCLHALCSSCCHACARCCSAIQEAPVEELNCNAHCHSVMFESCCEPTECLEFCLECCEICHRN